MAPPPAAAPGVPAVSVTCTTPCFVDARLVAPPSAILRVAGHTTGPAQLARLRTLLPGSEAPRTLTLHPTPAGARLVGAEAPGRLSADLTVAVRDDADPPVTATARVVMGKDRPYPVVVGRSWAGRPLVVHLPDGPADMLVMGAIHGNEPQGAWTLVNALGRVGAAGLREAVMVVANPDGYHLHTRRNLHGVDLNRNFPGRTWGTGVTPGPRPASEPETRAILRTLALLRPARLVTLHAPQTLVEDPEFTPLGCWLARGTGLPLARSVGYATPGSLGDWSAEHHLPEVTIELPPGRPSARVVDTLTRTLAGEAPANRP
ncbi:MAG: M14 family zinc carboxypeptidase [Thermoleophilia bacterium]